MTITLWDRFIEGLSGPFRRRRSALFRTVFPQFRDMAVCDVGGAFTFWEKLPPELVPRRLVIVNTDPEEISRFGASALRHVEFVLYDGTTLPFGHLEFDVVVCNSVIEHVPPGRRQGLAAEIRRVANYYFVQTPALGFPIEPHFFMPFMHWLPRRIARGLAFVSPWRFLSRADRAFVIASFEEVRLLRLAELRRYFPEAVVYRETFLGLTKSFTVHGRGAEPRPAVPSP